MHTPLICAAGSNEVGIASTLGAVVNCGSMSWDGPPLLHSIENDNFDMAHWLLFHGADTSLTDRHLQTPWNKMWWLIL